jgi:hypothetical protein
MDKSKNFAVAAGLAGAIALATSASAAPVTSGSLALKNAAPSDVVQVRSRGFRGAGVGLGVGLAAGALIGAAAASSAFAYDPYWYGYDPVYAPAFASTCHWGDPWCHGSFGATFAAPAPAFVEPAPIVRRRPRVVIDPGPSVFAAPVPVFPRQRFLDANPALGTVQGASGID